MAPARRANPKFMRMFAQLERFNSAQRLAVVVFLARLVNGAPICALIDQIVREKLQCPCCAGRSLYRHGLANGLQRWRCRKCQRTFNGLTGTPLARLRLKYKWLAYLDCLRDPACTVHCAAAKVGVHPNTSFRWRHRFLQWTKFDRPAALAGIVEADEMSLLESQKGCKHLARPPRKRGRLNDKQAMAKELVNIVVARDRAGQTIDFIAGRGALKAKVLHAQLLPKLQPDVLLATDSNRVYRRFARDVTMTHRVVNMMRQLPIRGAIHLKNVSAYHSRFTGWLRHFRGVATRYLENYLGWQWAIDDQRIADAPRFLRAALGVFNSER